MCYNPYLVKMKALFILLLFFSINALGQESKLRFSTIEDSATWSKTSRGDSNYLALPSIKYSKYKTYIRTSSPGQIIDLYSMNNMTFKGILTNYIIEYTHTQTEGEYTKTAQCIYEKIDLDSILCTTAALKLLATRQDTLPTDSLIKSWNKRFNDCNEIEFEFRVKGHYIKQTYSCPWGQNDSNPNVHTILANYDTITKEFNLQAHYDTFTSYLPKGKTYSRDGFIMMYVPTQRQNRQLQKNKPYIEYLDSVKITLNKYLSDTLTRLFKVYNGLSCDDQFSLKFSKNNKLIKITTNSKFSGSEDRKDYHTCKKKIKEAFHHIRINFIHSKIAYWRELRYDGNKVFITDNYYEIE